MNFYKYYTVNEYNLNAIKEKYFYCSRPSQLNDLFDCRIPIEYHNKTDEELLEWIRCNGGDWLSGLLPSYKFPYNTVEELKESINNGTFEQYFYNAFNSKEIDSFHVFSLTNTYKNQVLWATYTNNQGICVEFEANQLQEIKRINPYINCKAEYGLQVLDFPNTREYSYSIINDTKFLNLFNVEYNFKPIEKFDIISDKYMIASPQTDLVDIYPSITQNLITKNSDWSYENEYRGIFRTYGKEDKIFDNKIYYSEEIIKSITFAYNAKKEKIEEVLKAVNEANFNHKIDFYIIKPNYSTKSIERYPITVEELQEINNEK